MLLSLVCGSPFLLPKSPHVVSSRSPLCALPLRAGFAFILCSQESKLVQAVGKYTAAIELNPTAIYLSNRAFCYVKLEQFGLAILDADLALT